MQISTDEKKSISFERFHYTSPNGNIEAYGVIPQSTFTLPVIIFCRGGNRDYGAIEERIVMNFMLPLAMAGYAVFGSQYSGGPNSEGKDEYGGKDTQDIFSLVESLKSRSENFDFSRMGILGVSRGAMMGMEVLRDGLQIKKAAFIGGMYDTQKTKEERPDIYEMWIKDNMFDVNNPEEINRRSAITFGDKLPNIRYLLMHSREDSKVPLRQAEDMKKILGDKAELVLFDGDDHGLRKAGMERNKKLVEWFSSI